MMHQIHRVPVVWFTGLSGSGKTTLATGLQARLQKSTLPCCVLDGDIVRRGLCSDLGFSQSERRENVRRIAECAQIISDSGVACCVACIAPLHEHRLLAKEILKDRYIEVFVSCRFEECKKRDVKGLYKAYEDGKIEQFTGGTSRYEIPKTPNIILNTEQTDVDMCIEILLRYLTESFLCR